MGIEGIEPTLNELKVQCFTFKLYTLAALDVFPAQGKHRGVR
jgi:hypothetical protein